MSGKQCRPDQTPRSAASRSALFVQAFLFAYKAKYSNSLYQSSYILYKNYVILHSRNAVNELYGHAHIPPHESVGTTIMNRLVPLSLTGDILNKL